MKAKVADRRDRRKVQLAPTLLFMAEQQKKRRGAVEMGATAATVAANVRRLRDEVRGWSTYDLAGRLTKVGRPIAPSAVSKIERGERQVTVDDLLALAYVLGVTPNALLLPNTADGTVELTGLGSAQADTVWAWAEGERPLDLPDGDDGTAHNQFQADVRPAGRRQFVSGPVTVTARFGGRHGSGQLRGVVKDDERRAKDRDHTEADSDG